MLSVGNCCLSCVDGYDVVICEIIHKTEQKAAKLYYTSLSLSLYIYIYQLTRDDIVNMRTVNGDLLAGYNVCVSKHLASSRKEFSWGCKFVDDVFVLMDLRCNLCQKLDGVSASSIIQYAICSVIKQRYRRRHTEVYEKYNDSILLSMHNKQVKTNYKKTKKQTNTHTNTQKNNEIIMYGYVVCIVDLEIWHLKCAIAFISGWCKLPYS